MPYTAILPAIALLLLLTWAHLVFWRRKLTRPVVYDETHRIKTPDGCGYELRRLQPVTPSAEVPLLLVHGVAINHRNLDADDNLSLARTLRASGRDVWLLTLRSGRSDLLPSEWSKVRFEAMVDHDVPLAAREVLRRTSAEQLDYIGFSMGGMLLYASLGRTLPQGQVRRAVIIGSPGRVGKQVPGSGVLTLLPGPLLTRAPLRTLSQYFAFASEWFPTVVHGITMHLPNAMPGYVRHAAVDAVQSIPAPLLRDMVRWSQRDQIPRLRDGRDILAGLATVDVPVLFVGGTQDRLCPPRALQAAFDAWGCNLGHTLKRMHLVGKAHGHLEDYGHADLAIGKRSQVEVFAPIVEFLR